MTTQETQDKLAEYAVLYAGKEQEIARWMDELEEVWKQVVQMVITQARNESQR